MITVAAFVLIKNYKVLLLEKSDDWKQTQQLKTGAFILA